MNVNEMRDRLDDFCSEHGEGCIGCVLKTSPSCAFYCMDRNELITVYKKVFGENKVNPDCEAYTDKKINHPVHYQGKNECIDVMVAMFGKEAVKHFCMCNAYKYRFRADMKNGAEDIEKAEWYETKLIELGGVDNDSK